MEQENVDVVWVDTLEDYADYFDCRVVVFVEWLFQLFDDDFDNVDSTANLFNDLFVVLNEITNCGNGIFYSSCF